MKNVFWCSRCDSYIWWAIWHYPGHKHLPGKVRTDHPESEEAKQQGLARTQVPSVGSESLSSQQICQCVQSSGQKSPPAMKISGLSQACCGAHKAWHWHFQFLLVTIVNCILEIYQDCRVYKWRIQLMNAEVHFKYFLRCMDLISFHNASSLLIVFLHNYNKIVLALFFNFCLIVLFILMKILMIRYVIL